MRVASEGRDRRGPRCCGDDRRVGGRARGRRVAPARGGAGRAWGYAPQGPCLRPYCKRRSAYCWHLHAAHSRASKAKFGHRNCACPVRAPGARGDPARVCRVDSRAAAGARGGRAAPPLRGDAAGGGRRDLPGGSPAARALDGGMIHSHARANQAPACDSASSPFPATTSLNTRTILPRPPLPDGRTGRTRPAAATRPTRCRCSSRRTPGESPRGPVWIRAREKAPLLARQQPIGQCLTWLAAQQLMESINSFTGARH